jgi:putative ABC transport system permease protein
VLSYIIGFDPDEPLGGPQQVVVGTAALQRDEVIIDEAVARSQGFGLGDEIEIFGEAFTIVGMTRGLTNIINSVTFIHLENFQDLRGNEAISYALLKAKPGYDPAEIARAITARNNDVLALTQSDFSREEKQIIKDMSVEVLNLMNLSGLLIGLAVTALTLYTSTLSKRREYGVLKAIGAKNRQLYSVVIAQAFFSLVIGFGIAIGLVWLMELLLPQFIPGFNMALRNESVLRVLLAALIMGCIAALVPTWQVAQLDPARVFRG